MRNFILWIIKFFGLQDMLHIFPIRFEFFGCDAKLGSEWSSELRNYNLNITGIIWKWNLTLFLMFVCFYNITIDTKIPADKSYVKSEKLESKLIILSVFLTLNVLINCPLCNETHVVC